MTLNSLSIFRGELQTTRRLVIVPPIDQPTTIREYRSSTAARYTQPSRVPM